jgi:hypothetical protein
MPKHTPSRHVLPTVALRNVINHHTTLGDAICNRSRYTDNKLKYAWLMKEAARHFAIVDDCRRKLWLAEHSK